MTGYKLNGMANMLEECEVTPEDIEKLDPKVRRLVYMMHEENTRLGEISTIDPLTRLPNERVFGPRTENVISEMGARERRHSQRGAARARADVHNFKYINDNLGHQTGNLTLKAVADSLNRCTRHGDDIVSRLGGASDEFDILFTQTDGRDLERNLYTAVLRLPLRAGEVSVKTGGGTPYTAGLDIGATVMHKPWVMEKVSKYSESDVRNMIDEHVDRAMYITKNTRKENEVAEGQESGKEKLICLWMPEGYDAELVDGIRIWHADNMYASELVDQKEEFYLYRIGTAD